MGYTLREEEQLILLLTAREQLNHQETITEINYFLEKMTKEEWERFVYIIRRNGITPTVYYNLLHYDQIRSSLIPDQVMSYMKEIFIQNKQDEILYESLKKTLASEFYKENIKVVFIKGATYRKYLNLDSGYRLSRDLDILVHEEELFKVDEVIRNLGFNNSGMENATKDECLNIAAKQFECYPYGVMEYEKLDDHKRKVRLDMHKASEDNTLCGMQIYKEAKLIPEENVYEMDAFDLFIYSCFHALHHYGTDYDYTNFNNLPKLKQYVDIKDLLTYFEHCNVIDQLAKRIKQANVAKEVNEMVKLTEYIFRRKFEVIPGCTDQSAIMEYDVDYFGYQSNFVERMFRPNEEKEKIATFIGPDSKKENIDDLFSCYLCTKIVNPFTWCEEICWRDCYQYDSGVDAIWTGAKNMWHINEQQYKNRFGSISCQWDENNLYIKWNMHDEYSRFGKKDTFCINQDNILIYTTIEGVPSSIYVQPRETGKHKVYCCSNYDVRNYVELNNTEVKADISETDFCVYIKIPWCVFKIVPCVGAKIDFSPQMLVPNGKMEYPTNISFYRLNKCDLLLTQDKQVQI